MCIFPSVFSEGVFLESVLSKIVFFQSVFSQSVLPQSVFMQSVFLQNVPDLRVFQALRVYMWSGLVWYHLPPLFPPSFCVPKLDV